MGVQRKTYNVHNPAERLGNPERTVIREHLSAAEDIDRRGNGIGDTKSHNGCRCDSVESAARAQEDAAKDDDPSHSPEQSVDRHVESGVHLSEDTAEGHSLVTSESVAHSGAGGDQGDGGEKHADEGEHEEAHTASLAVGCVHEDLQQRTVSSTDDVVDVLDAEEQRGEEDESSEHANADAVEHDLGALLVRLRNFLNHVGNRIETCSSETS